ncbi:MAG: hypothetical protein ACK51S_15380 [Alphaproteobacteria bacterium]
MILQRLTLAAFTLFAAAGNAVSDPNAASSVAIELRAYVPAVCEAALKSASLASDGLTATYALSARCNTPHTVEVSLAGTPGTRATIRFDRTTRTVPGDGTTTFFSDTTTNGMREISVSFRNIPAEDATAYLRATRISFRAS